MRETVLYYHIYLSDDYANWSSIFMEQMKLTEDTGLKNQFDRYEISFITQEDQRIDIFVGLCKMLNKPVNLIGHKNPYANDIEMINNVNTPKTASETKAIAKIWEDAKTKDMDILYLHSKGITAVKNALERGNVDLYKKYHYWRQYMNWGVIENWNLCLNALQYDDVSGVGFLTKPAKHFCGNFWWTKSEHLRTLPNPTDNVWWNNLKESSDNVWLKTAADRFRDELWVCSRPDVKIFSVHNFEEKESPLAFPMTKDKYFGKQNLFWHPV